jgi:hypothetical protein
VLPIAQNEKVVTTILVGKTGFFQDDLVSIVAGDAQLVCLLHFHDFTPTHVHIQDLQSLWSDTPFNLDKETRTHRVIGSEVSIIGLAGKNHEACAGLARFLAYVPNYLAIKAPNRLQTDTRAFVVPSVL